MSTDTCKLTQIKNTLSHSLSWILTARQTCDLECLLNDSFLPLTGFMDEANYLSVCQNMRLVSGALFPIPVTLDVSDDFAQLISVGDSILLRSADQSPFASLCVTSLWQPNKIEEAWQVYGTTDTAHPGVNYLLNMAHSWYIGGTISLIQLPQHFDFHAYRQTPAQLKAYFTQQGWDKVVGFQTRNPMHRAHFELTKRAALEHDAHLLIHPVVGQTKPDDVDYVTRVKCYIQLLRHYSPGQAILSLLPLAMRMAGPREALWHGMIRKNYGVTHFILGRDHAGVSHANGPFYQPYAAHELFCTHADEIGLTPVFYSTMAYVKEKNQFLLEEEIEAHHTVENISGTKLREVLRKGGDIPDWFTFSDIQAILKQTFLPQYQQGFTVLLTGLSGAGKSTIAHALIALLQESTHRSVTLLDGDIVRRNLSKELGFSPRDRETHLQRMGFVAAEITKHRGIAIIAAIAPYAQSRIELRQLVEPYGEFVEIYVATALSLCQQRDVKGLYTKAHAGELLEFTGVSAPYEAPLAPDMIIDTASQTVDVTVQIIAQELKQMGLLL